MKNKQNGIVAFLTLGVCWEVIAQPTGSLTYAPLLGNSATTQPVPFPLFWLFPLGLFLAAIGVRFIMKDGAGHTLGVLLAVGGAGALLASGIHMQRVIAQPPAPVELNEPGGGTVVVPGGFQEYVNTSGVEQRITALTPPTCPSDSPAGECGVGDAIAPGGGCATSYTCTPPVPVVSIANSADAAEPATDGGFIVTSSLPAPSGGLSVAYTVAGSATAGSDYSALSGSVVIPEGATTAAIGVAVVDDTVYDPSENIDIQLLAGTGFNLGTDTASVTITAPDKRIFQAAAVNDGNLGGIAGADGICEADVNHPDPGNTQFKTLLAGVGRSAAPAPTDWVLAAGTSYFKVDAGNTYIATANAASTFDFPLGTTIGPGAPGRVWTGLNADWTTAVETCGNWTATTGFGRFGATWSGAPATGTNAIDAGTFGCVGTTNLYCVEQ